MPVAKTSGNVIADDIVWEELNEFSEQRREFGATLVQIITGIELNEERIQGLLINFFEKIGSICDELSIAHQTSPNSFYNPHIFDHAGCAIHELFLDTVAVCINNNKWDIVKGLLEHSYFFETIDLSIFIKTNRQFVNA